MTTIKDAYAKTEDLFYEDITVGAEIASRVYGVDARILKLVMLAAISKLLFDGKIILIKRDGE